ncbi:hypothetical protein D0Y65_004049 [Glycine soja]|uniref:Uncharacterized protein n=1 Tax=Glycine soja TaxID=3848 RepID=A0A445LQ14_GLYSO|nr:hypothetical protein D0Y65_004049 [Glycine soja]
MGQSRLTTPNGAIPHRPSTSLFPFSPKSHNPIVGKRKWKREELCGTPRYVELRYHWRVHILWSRRIHILWSRRILKLHMRPDFSNCGYCNRSTHCTNVTLDQSLTYDFEGGDSFASFGDDCERISMEQPKIVEVQSEKEGRVGRIKFQYERRAKANKLGHYMVLPES